ncbi:MAG: hypothetical protein LLG04_13275 [Parachlamydia sp.]|nr:hypothetical protein [Parachlamydia sp.]
MVWELCKTCPDEVEQLVPFLGACLDEHRPFVHLTEKDQETMGEYLEDKLENNPSLSDSLLRLIATYLYPDILVDSILSERKNLSTRLIKAKIDITGTYFQECVSRGYMRTFTLPLLETVKVDNDETFNLLLSNFEKNELRQMIDCAEGKKIYSVRSSKYQI